MFNPSLSAPLVSIPANELVMPTMKARRKSARPVNFIPVSEMYAVATVKYISGNTEVFAQVFPKDITIESADIKFKEWAHNLQNNLNNVLEIEISIPLNEGVIWTY